MVREMLVAAVVVVVVVVLVVVVVELHKVRRLGKARVEQFAYPGQTKRRWHYLSAI